MNFFVSFLYVSVVEVASVTEAEVATSFLSFTFFRWNFISSTKKNKWEENGLKYVTKITYCGSIYLLILLLHLLEEEKKEQNK